VQLRDGDKLGERGEAHVMFERNGEIEGRRKEIEGGAMT